MDSGAQKRLLGQLKAVAARGDIRYTRFLDPAEAAETQALARAQGVASCLWCGYPQGERCMAALGTAELAQCEFPLVPLQVTWDSRFTALQHRDLLGALMALGLERDSFGDILPEEGRAYVFVIAEQAGYVCRQFTQAGNATLDTQRVATLPPQLGRTAPREITTTVLSLRLDAVLAPAFGLSREKAATAIRMGLVKRNHLVELRPDVHVQQGDLFSLRGQGRATLREIGGTSRKGRTFIKLDRYG